MQLVHNGVLTMNGMEKFLRSYGTKGLLFASLKSIGQYLDPEGVWCCFFTLGCLEIEVYD